MAGNFEIPGLMTSSEPVTAQNQPNPQNEAQQVTSQVTSQPSTEMEVDSTAPTEISLPRQSDEIEKKGSEDNDAQITDAPPSPPSLISALEALLGGLDSQPQPQPQQQASNATPALPNGTEQNEQTNEQEVQGDPEWEEDSSPYESSSDSSSSDDSDDESEDGKNYKLLGPEETARILMEMEGGSDDEGEGKTKGLGSGAQVRTKNEMPEEVVPKPDVTITPEMTVTELGVIEHIVENTAVIKANTTGEYQVLDTGSVLCTEGRTVIAAIADLIGNVRQPRYTARFTNEEEIKSFGLELGTKVFYPPSHATYVFTQALRVQKGTDASNWHDEEAGDDEMEFSDDEKEAEYKRQQKAKKKAGRGGKGGAGVRGGHSETPSFPVASGLQYDDDDDDGPYRKLARPSNFAQSQPASSETGFMNNHGNNNGSFRGGRGRGQRGYGRGRGHRGDSRGGHSLPPRPPRGQDYQPQSHQYNYNPVPPPPVANTTYPPPVPFYGTPNGHSQPNAQYPFPWPQNIPQGFVPPPPPQFTGQQSGTNPYYSPEFFAALQSQMQGQSNQQGGQWPGHGGTG
ncbi:NAF1-domain-containing protein [Annulohypoxylon maeteangense]|uniref:NAF1-domain-containing protein n=1 Tax=Annulohypoxylon maeteangense TaxID=1927788 RepID=UPI002007D304|nr:NAF1-domain-containing protein [Annulohypoxylon maeteangense]KAI0888740.1 NAF1-domain-containing protein [Annulohypoxylon maeteangense]